MWHPWRGFDLEDEGTEIIRNTANGLPDNTAERPRRLQQYRYGNLGSCTSRLFVRMILQNVIRDIVCRLAMVITLHPLQLSSN